MKPNQKAALRSELRKPRYKNKSDAAVLADLKAEVVSEGPFPAAEIAETLADRGKVEAATEAAAFFQAIDRQTIDLSKPKDMGRVNTVFSYLRALPSRVLKDQAGNPVPVADQSDLDAVKLLGRDRDKRPLDERITGHSINLGDVMAARK